MPAKWAEDMTEEQKERMSHGFQEVIDVLQELIDAKEEGIV